MTGLEPGQRAGLLAAKLGALVRRGWGERAAERDDFPGGAALVDGTTGWLLLDSTPLAALGPAVVWADRRGLVDVHLLTEVDAGVLARRADLFTNAPTVWVIDGTEVRPVEAVPSQPEAPPTPAPALAGLLVDADLEVVVEDSIVRGEVLGLEVARIVHGATTAGTPIDEPVLEVGVGHADRELTGMLHGNLPPATQLARVVEIVTQQRRADAERHPLNQLAPERWLRARLVNDPARLGLAELHAAPPAVPRPNLRDPAIAVAVGRAEDGADVVVACSVGIHLDLVPAAADARQALAPEARLLLVVPERDAHPVTRALAQRLTHPAEVVALEGDWRT
ncbi:MAG: hypothetical protein ABIX10_06385 [Acidimicrobiales bacterium]